MSIKTIAKTPKKFRLLCDIPCETKDFCRLY